MRMWLQMHSTTRYCFGQSIRLRLGRMPVLPEIWVTYTNAHLADNWAWL
jgi:hypothetical protein